mmetsp:Transcript_4276/g.4698  ORF Transcript_4276/g.4698 Transcript_4276/m.4698 type:complete len:359 (-) Transcript_4276:518-1594(-)
MKIITEDNVVRYFNSTLSRDSIINKFQPSLLKGLINYEKDPSNIVPPRTVQTSNTKNSDSTHLFMPCIAPNEVGIKLISGGPSNSKNGLGFQGCILVLDEYTGSLQGVLNAKSITAFRTALASTIPIVKVLDPYDSDASIASISVFGVGLQAYWHVKLALLLYQDKVRHVHIVNRTLKNAQELASKLSTEFPEVTFESYLYSEEDQLSTIKKQVSESSIIFGCSPSTEAVIKADYINQDPKKKKFISLIGSYKPHMIELDLDFIVPQYKEAASKPKILVDSKEHTLHEAGELIQSGIDKDQLIELTDFCNSQRETHEYTTTTNVVVLKLVGLSVMDLSIAKMIIKDIDESQIISVPDF